MSLTAEALLDQTLALSVPLHDAIAAFDQEGMSYAIADAPGIALFERDAGDTISHWSSSPVPAVVDAVDSLRVRHQLAAGVDGFDNSHLPALLLACLFVADETSVVRQRLGSRVNRPAAIEALDVEHGKHDPELEPHDAAVRVWTPLVCADDPEVHVAVLQMRFVSGRTARYAPW